MTVRPKSVRTRLCHDWCAPIAAKVEKADGYAAFTPRQPSTKRDQSAGCQLALEVGQALFVIEEAAEGVADLGDSFRK